MKLKVKLLRPSAVMPKYMTAGAACFDIFNAEAYAHTIRPGRALTFNTGLAFEVPQGYALMVYSRSGHGFKHGIRLVNCVGVIDSDYRGELLVRLANDNPRLGATVKPGDRIAQGMLIPVPAVEFEAVDTLSDTPRGEGGLGSTG